MLDESILAIMATREKSKVKPLKKIFKGVSPKKTPKKTRRKAAPKGTHRMAGGLLMSGSKHTADSKPVKKTRKMKKKMGY